MTWDPITLSELQELMAGDLAEADDDVLAVWEEIRITPTKWSCSPMGDLGGGFWVVAKYAGTVLWYNDIEDGFNTSPFVEDGIIREYRCNQSDFGLCLRHVAVERSSKAVAASGAVGEVPECLRGPGAIVRRQTSYWTVQPTTGHPWRVHFTDKLEFRFVEAAFTSLDLASQHPLLMDHDEPWQTLYFLGVPSEPKLVLSKASQSVSAATEGWRCLAQYLNRSAPFAGRYGALLSAPGSLISPIAALLNSYGSQTSILPNKPNSPGRSLQVCLFGRSYVVARAFRFEPLAHTPQ